MSDYLFFFGRTPKLAWIELLGFFPNAKEFLEHCAVVSKEEFESKGLTPVDWVQKLGGVVKIAVIAASVPSVTPEAIASVLVDASHEKRLTFGVSVSEGVQPVTRRFLEEIKSLVELEGYHARFVEPRHGSALSSVVITKNDLIDITIIKHKTEFLFARTVAVQDFESWNSRDYGRPFADPKSGMLPPKAARMAVNIAGEKGTLLDPFCGMGTILGEALLMGWRVLGSDQSEDVVEKARKNLEWLDKPDWKLLASDATHVSEKIPLASVDAIVTEPFMGAADIKFENIKNIMKGLEKLYIGCLRDWYNVLKPGGKIVIALPEYRIEDKMFFVKKVIDRCENLGYTTLYGPIEYSRPQAVVRRQFYIFQKK